MRRVKVISAEPSRVEQKSNGGGDKMAFVDM
jgi:hypothetical protein